MDLSDINANHSDRLRDAAELKHFVDWEYNPIIKQKITKYKWNLPIVAEDCCYAMDIMFIRDLSIESVGGINKRNIWTKNLDRRQ